MAKYIIEECTDIKEWDDFADKSPQGTIFSKSKFIDSIANNIKLIIKKGNEVAAAVHILLTDSGRPLIEQPFLQYSNSIMFRNNQKLLAHKQINEEFRITELIINEILQLFDEFSIINTPSFTDIRPFLWHNFNNPEHGVFANKINYTPILDLANKNESDIIAEIRGCRRQELKKKEDFRIEESDDIALLDELHTLTLKKHNKELGILEKEMLFKITKASLEFNYGRLMIGYYDDNPVSATLFLHDSERGYYLFGANHPEFRNTGLSTKLMMNNILYFKKLELKELDFIGANSPHRGDYKVSFNCNIKPYYSSSIVLKK
ncbi:GNAT family N-acetyltransferase [Flavobacteriaceae bacterium]|nr:GNAT family N-acetyltransferase [Flavobacteriaceae bacterium]